MLDILACNIEGIDWHTSGMILLPQITVLVVTLIKIAVPIILVIFGMIDLAKAVMSNDEKEMKGAQTKLIKRVIYAVAVFLVVTIVQLIFSALDSTDEDTSDVTGCISCFISNAENC